VEGSGAEHFGLIIHPHKDDRTVWRLGGIGVPKREWVDDWSHAPSTAQPK